MDNMAEDAINLYFEVIAATVKASDIIPRLVESGYVTQEFALRVNKVEMNDCYESASRELIEKLKSDDKPGWCSVFLRELQQNDYEYVENVLSSFGDVQKQGLFKAMIELYYVELINEIQPNKLTSHLLSTKCINEDDEDVIRKIQQKSSRVAMICLLQAVARRKEDWLGELLIAMKESNGDVYYTLIKTIEPRLDKAGFNVKDQLERFAEDQRVGYQQTEYSEGGKGADNFALNVPFTCEYSEGGKGADNFASNIPSTSTCIKQELKDETSLKQLSSASNFPPGASNFPSIPAQNVDAMSEMSIEDNQLLEDIEPDELVLKPFQKELVEPCYAGQNKLIMAPTNSGKTFVAMGIVKDHLQCNKTINTREFPARRKVMFLVPKVCLAKQQHRKFLTYLSDYSSCHITGRRQGEMETKTPLSMLLACYDIVVATAQILVLNLEDESVSLGDISLLIFDECHLTQGGNPMQSVMNFYIDKKLSEQNAMLPQIVGLTASVGIGTSKRPNVQMAMEHIFKLCANLDCTLHTVTRETHDLMDYTKEKRNERVSVSGRLYDPFFDSIQSTMATVENKLQDLAAQTVIPSSNASAPTRYGFPDVGTQKYEQYVCAIEKGQLKDRWAQFTCIKYLKILNRALLLNRDCESVDALRYIQEALEGAEPGKSEQSNPTEDWLYQLYLRDRNDWERTCRLQSNPKLQRMKDIILDKLVGKAEARAIVMVQTRKMTRALQRYFSENFDMTDNKIPVGRFVGSGASTEQAGMERGEWDNTMKKFREGEIRLLIATNVVEMGLDVPDCSLVVNYERPQDEISKVQSEGRARAKDALLITLGQDKVVLKDKVNEMRVELMEQAVTKVKDVGTNIAQNLLKKHQQSALLALKHKKKLLEISKSGKVADANRFKFLCQKCRCFVCNASDVRLVKGAHHVVISPDFVQKFTLKPHKKPSMMTDEFYKTHKLHCRKCNHDWGVKAVYRETNLPFLKQGSFLIDEDNENKILPLTKWGDLKFTIPEVDDMGELESICSEIYPNTDQ